MKPEAQNIAVALATGARWIDNGHGRRRLAFPFIDGRYPGPDADESMPLADNPLDGMPDYGRDLNAMHAAWKAQIWDRLLQPAWRVHLHAIVLRDRNQVGFHSVSNATAMQRREAFLRTTGQWEGE